MNQSCDYLGSYMSTKRFTKLVNYDDREVSMVSGVCQIKDDFNEINDDFRAQSDRNLEW